MEHYCFDLNLELFYVLEQFHEEEKIMPILTGYKINNCTLRNAHVKQRNKG